MTKEEIIDGIIELVGEKKTKKAFQKITKEIFDKALEKMLSNKDIHDISGIKKLIDRVFELCPECNFIPFAYTYNDYTDLSTEKDFDELYRLCEDYLVDKGYVLPDENEDMKIKEAKELYSILEQIVNDNNVQEGIDKGVCDYTENTFYSVYGYDRNKCEVVELCDINYLN